jgi:serine/threonine protein kinase
VLHIAVDDIELGKKLGEGAFGVVYKGKWHGKNVAVKQVKAGVIGGKKATAEFEAEVGNMAAITYHENLVQLHGVTTLENGDLAAVVEFCANGALVGALYGKKARADWSADQLMRIAHGAACGVAHLHRLSVVHRDIAARNVLLAKDDTPKVADFGMARLVSDDVYEQQTTNPIGPLKWMAPEQIESRLYSKASDVFAFGVLLFEIFKREAPWSGVYNLDVAFKIRTGERMDVSSRKIPSEIATLMKECWAHATKERPSMEKVQTVLHDCLREDYSSESSSVSSQ